MRITLFIILLSTSIFGQTKVDSIFSIKFPTKPEKFEISKKAENGIGYFYNNENDSFIAMSLKTDKGESEFKNNLPNLKSLRKAYEKMIDLQIQAMRKKQFIFKDSTEIKINDFIGYKLTYQDENSENQNAESILFLINGINFIATYSRVNKYNNENKNKFLNSIKINTSNNPEQLAEAYNLKENLLGIILKGIFVFGIFYVLKKYKKTTGNTV